MGDLDEIVPELNEDRVVEPIGLSDRFELFGCGAAGLAGDDGGRISGGQMDEDEVEDDDGEKEEHGLPDA